MPNRIHSLLFTIRGVVLRRWHRLCKSVTLGARVIVDDGEGNVLLVRHSYGDGAWYLPGGGVRRGESFSAAALRELREETGLDSRPAMVHSICINRVEGRTDHIVVFVAEVATGGPIVPSSSEIAEVGWHPLDDLPANLSPGTARRLQEHREGQLALAREW